MLSKRAMVLASRFTARCEYTSRSMSSPSAYTCAPLLATKSISLRTGSKNWQRRS